MNGRHKISSFRFVTKMMTLLAVVGVVLALAPAAQADATWTGLGDGFSWSDNGNWDVADITTAGGMIILK